MGLRKAGAYSRRYARPYTRKSKVKKRSYIKTIPNTKVVKLRMGDLARYIAGKFPIIMHIKTTSQVQIRDNALEATRQFLHRFLTEKIGKDYYLELKVYPHHILRENKMLTGAGADRMQTGMALSFGACIGRAAFLKKGQTIFTAAVMTPKQEAETRKLIGSIRARLPCAVSIETIHQKI